MSLNEILNSDNLKPILGIGVASLFTIGMAVIYCRKGEKRKKEEEKQKSKRRRKRGTKSGRK